MLEIFSSGRTNLEGTGAASAALNAMGQDMPTDMIPLKYATRINSTTLPETIDTSFSFLYIDIGSVTAGGHIEMPEGLTSFGEAPSRARRTAPPGAVVVSTVRTYLRAVARVPVSEDPLVFSTGFATLEAKDSVDPGFLAYVCQSDSFVDEVVARSVGVSYPAINSSDLGAIRIPLPPVEEQRRIADFLDDQVARIDELLMVSQQQTKELIALPAQRFACELAAVSSETAVLKTKLGHVLRQFTNGYVGPTRDLLVEDGIPYIQSLHIKNGAINFGIRPYFVPPEWHFARPRIHLKSGDVLIVQTGDIGSVAVVPPDFPQASCHALIIARPRKAVIRSEYLGEFLRSDKGQAELLSRATGALHPHLESGIKDAAVLVPELEFQDRIVARLAEVRRYVHDGLEACRARGALFEERKRAVITAAVTGELDVTTARPIGVGKWVPNVGASVDSATTAQAQAPSIGGIG